MHSKRTKWCVFLLLFFFFFRLVSQVFVHCQGSFGGRKTPHPGLGKQLFGLCRDEKSFLRHAPVCMPAKLIGALAAHV